MQAMIEAEQDTVQHARLQQSHLKFLEEALLLVAELKRTLSTARAVESASVDFWQVCVSAWYYPHLELPTAS